MRNQEERVSSGMTSVLLGVVSNLVPRLFLLDKLVGLIRQCESVSIQGVVDRKGVFIAQNLTKRRSTDTTEAAAIFVGRKRLIHLNTFLSFEPNKIVVLDERNRRRSNLATT